VLRSSGLASTQSTTGNQEAKDFKVVVTLQNPPAGLRPGLSSTAKITTAQKKNVVTIPIQALAERTKKDLDEAAKENGQNSVTLAADRPAPDASGSTSSLEKNPEILGVFVVRDKRARFVPVATGITGVTDIEVTSGLQEGDQIITGSYKTLRTLKPAARVKVDNSPPKTGEEN
jgi:HlyD family secretion protein